MGCSVQAESLMRDIRADLRDRAQSVTDQITAEDARFKNLVSELRAEQNSTLEHLRAQLRLANRLLQFTIWHDNVRADLATRIAVAEAAENLIRQTLGAASGSF